MAQANQPTDGDDDSTDTDLNTECLRVLDPPKKSVPEDSPNLDEGQLVENDDGTYGVVYHGTIIGSWDDAGPAATVGKALMNNASGADTQDDD